MPPECDAVPDSDIANLGTGGFYNSDPLAFENCGEFRFVAGGALLERLPHKFSAALLNIEKIDARGTNAHEGLQRAGNRYRQFFESHHVGPSIAMNANRFPHHRVLAPGPRRGTEPDP